MIEGHPWYEFEKARKNVIWWLHNTKRMTEQQIGMEIYITHEEIKEFIDTVNKND